MTDTLVVSVAPDETSDMRREKQVNVLKMGLMRYVLKTPLSKYFKINFDKPLSETVTSDKWNSWVFTSSLYCYLSGEKSYKYNEIWDLSTQTEQQKIGKLI